MSPVYSLTKRYAIAAALIALLVAAPALIVQAQGERTRLEQIKNEIRTIKGRLANKKATAAEIRSNVATLDARIAELDFQVRSGEHDISTLESDIRTNEARIAELEGEYEEASDASNQRARRLYMNGPVESITRLFEAEDMGEFLRRAVLWEVAAELDAKVILRAARLRGELEEHRAGLVEIRNDLAKQRQWLLERRNLVAQARAERAGALAKINSEIATEEEHIKKLKRDSEILEARIFSALSRSTGRVSRSGFIWPHRGSINSPYGWRSGGFHTGIDIGGDTGNPVRASKSGYVVGISCGSGYGICSLIDHGNGVSTLYAHLSGKSVYSGFVERGQVIGWIGCTGWCTGSHLHFEVRVNGQHRNPMYFLP